MNEDRPRVKKTIPEIDIDLKENADHMTLFCAILKMILVEQVVFAFCTLLIYLYWYVFFLYFNAVNVYSMHLETKRGSYPGF